MIIISQLLGFPLDGIKKYKQWTGALAFLQSGYDDLDAKEEPRSSSLPPCFTPNTLVRVPARTRGEPEGCQASKSETFKY